MTATAYTWTPPQEIEYELGPWKGVLDAVQPTAAKKHYLALAYNVWVRALNLGGTVVSGRPGFTLAGGQGGSGGDRTPQRSYQFNQKDGTARTVRVCGGRIDTYDWGTDTWTNRIDGTDLSGASITLSATARVYCVTFNNKLVVSDGINTPFAWDGTAHGGLTKMTNAPVFFGQPWVYANQLMGIKNADRLTISWSEVAAENTGYEAGGYNNSWTVFQTSQDVLVAGAALNDAFVLLRPFSCTAILGAMSSEFRTTHSREALSETVGTSSPAAVWVEDDKVYFIGSDKKFYRATRGGGVEEIALGATEIMRSISTASLADAVVSPRTLMRTVVFGLRETGVTAPNTYVAIDTETTDCVGIWRGWQCLALDEVTNSVTSEPTLMHGGGSTPTTATDGWFYKHAQPTGTTWDDVLQAASYPIAHEIAFYAGYDTTWVKRFDRLDLRFLASASMTGASLQWETPGMTGNAQNFSFTAGSGGQYDVAKYDQAVYGGLATERRVTCGTKAEGRGARFRIAHSAAGEEFNLLAATVTTIPLDKRVKVN